MDENIELKLVGITYNQVESGVYALILEDKEMGKRMAIVIGYPEAQSIECKLQNVRTPRPLTHDLLVNILSALDAEVLRVDIHRLPSGPYAGKLTVATAGGDIKELDARSSDAIAIALRTGAPIFTTRELLDKVGFMPKSTPITRKPVKRAVETSDNSGLEKLSLSQLQEMLNQNVAEENYEEAAKIKKEIERRSQKEQ